MDRFHDPGRRRYHVAGFTSARLREISRIAALNGPWIENLEIGVVEPSEAGRQPVQFGCSRKVTQQHWLAVDLHAGRPEPVRTGR